MQFVVANFKMVRILLDFHPISLDLLIFRIHSTSSLASIKPMSPQEHQISREQFWDKNKRLQRPISPHLTIYKFQMTSMLSITHRGTGLAQSAILSGAAIWAIATNTSFPALLTSVQALGFGSALIFLGKFAIAWPVVYHLLNGLRHLVSQAFYIH